MRILIIIIALVSFSLSAQEHVQYQQGEPINIQVTVDKETRVVFPEPVRKARSSNLDELMMGSLIESTFYVTPKKQFNARLIFQGLDSGRIYVVTMNSTQNSSVSKVTVHAKNDLPDEGTTDQGKAAPKVVITPIDLIQYASQSLYAPDESLIEGVPGIRRVKVSRSMLDRTFYKGGDFLAKPYASWSSAGVYVTAVEMKNIRSAALAWSVCNIRGDFVAVAPQASTETPRLNSESAMMFYFVSAKPFSVAAASEGVSCLR